MVLVDCSENPYITENSFYYVPENDKFPEYATESLPENRKRGLETCRRSKLFEQLTDWAKLNKR